ncbi:hypothetical protein QYF61_008891, partial [Mycteria americana]
MAAGPPPGPLANGVAATAAGRGAAANEGAEETRRRPEAANEGREGRRGSKAAAGSTAGVEVGSTPPNEGSTEAGTGAAAANEGSEPHPRAAAAILRSVEVTAGAEADGRSTAASAGSTVANAGSTAANVGSTEASAGSTAANVGSTEASAGSTAANEEPEDHGTSTAASVGSTAANAGSTVTSVGSTAANEKAEAHGRSTAAMSGSTVANTGSTAVTTGSTVTSVGSTAANEKAEAHGGSTAAVLGSTVANTGSTAAISGSTVTSVGPTAANTGSTGANEEPEAHGKSTAAISGSTAADAGSSAAISGSTAANAGSSAAISGSTAANKEPEPRTTSAAAILEPSPSEAAPETPATSTAATSEPSAAPPAAVSGSPGERSLAGANGPGRGSQSSLGPGIPGPRGRDLDSVSLLSGTLESLAGSFPDDASSMGSDSELSAPSYRRTDRYGFLGGSQYCEAPESSVPVDVARQRELKWLEMFNHWDKWLLRRYQKVGPAPRRGPWRGGALGGPHDPQGVKLRCRKGIPSSLRARAWQLLSDSKALLDRNPGLFQELERQPGEPRWLDAIEKDLHRQFPFHEMFAARGGHGQQDLYRILKAYTVYRPQEGYCQAQAPVAAVLLMHMPAEQAFWCLVQICEKYLPGYYSAGLVRGGASGGGRAAGRGGCSGRCCGARPPAAHRHLRRFRVEPVLYLTEWFMCIFARSLPWAAVLRVWDMFFCEGTGGAGRGPGGRGRDPRPRVKIMFRVGLVLLRQALGTPEKLRSCQGMYETMERLRSVPPPRPARGRPGPP